MPSDFVQTKNEFNHAVCCCEFEYDADALRKAFEDTGLLVVVYEQEVHDTDTFNPSFSLEYEIMRIES